MNKNKLINYIALLFLSVVLLAYSTVLQFTMPSIVLCFGNDGHIAFEQSDKNFQCIDIEGDDDHATHEHENLAHDEDHCEDIPLSNLFSALFMGDDGKIKHVKISSVNTKNRTLKTDIDLHQYNSTIVVTHAAMKSLKSSILLI